MSLGTIHIFSSNYEKNNFDALADEVEKLAKRYYSVAVTVERDGIKYQTINVTTKRNLAIIRSGLRTMAVGHAYMT